MEEQILAALVSAVPGLVSVLAILGSLVVIGQAVVVATPSKTDDAAWEKIKAIPLLGGLISAVAAFAPIQKK